MKRLLILLTLILCVSARAQQSNTSARNQNFLNTNAQHGTTVPSACVYSSLFVKDDAVAGAQLYACVLGSFVQQGSGIGISALTGTGTANVLPKFTAATTLGDSAISDDGTDITVTGRNVKVGTKVLGTGGTIYPSADSTAAIQINKANGTTNVLTVDTTNGRVGIGVIPDRELVVGSLVIPSIRTRLLSDSPGPYDFNNLVIGEVRFDSGVADALWSYAPGIVAIGDPISDYGRSIGLQFHTTALGDITAMSILSSGNVGIATTSPIGKLQAVISATSPVIVGGATVGSYTAVTSPTANKDYINKTGIGTASTVGDLAVLTGGTGVYLGMYSVLNIIGADSIQLSRTLHNAGADVTDVAVSISTAPRLAVGTNRTYSSALLNAASGNEVAWKFDYTTNKAAGNDTGLQINMTDSASPGTSLPLQVNVGGVQKFSVDNTGNATAGNYVGLSNGFVLGESYSGLRMKSSNMMQWTTSTEYGFAVDAALSRTSAGLLQVNNGTAGKWAAVEAGVWKAQALAAPGSLAVAPTCVPGVCNLTWTYTVAAYLADGTTQSATPVAVSTALQNGTLDANNFNTITWAAVTGATNYTVSRTASGGTPATTGKLATCTNITALTCVDNGLVGSGVALLTGNQTGAVLLTTRTPAAGSESCAVGDIRFDTSYVYICAAANTWYRGAIATW
jgi:hypothetical protein